MGHQPPAARGRAARAGDARVHGLSPAHRGTRRLRGAGRSTAPVHVGLRRDRRAARRLAERALRPLDRDVYRSRLRGPSALVPRGLRRGRGRRLRGGTAPDAGGVPREQPVRARVLGGGLALRTLSPIAEDSPRPPEPVRAPPRGLVAESEPHGPALNTRMARLHCRTRAERLLIPPFLFFFNLL